MPPESPTGSSDLNSVTIGVLTALEEEYAACCDVFDPQRTGKEVQRRATSGTFTCWVCRISPRYGGGQYVVAISLLPHVGNNAVAIAANILLQHCPEIRHLLMCGIAGAVPHPKKPTDHVRLGDIVVSSGEGVIQYDRGKQRDAQRSVPQVGSSVVKERLIWTVWRWLKSMFARKSEDPAGHGPLTADPLTGFDYRGPPRPPCPVLLQAVSRMHAEEQMLGRDTRRDWESQIDAFLGRCASPENWKRPYHTKDRLIDSPDGKGQSIRHPKDDARRTVHGVKCPRVFRGPIGSANIVLGDPKKRDALRDRYGIKAVEMEGSGVADASWVAGVGYLVVRGTCDYCNTTKNDNWHNYAALIAAAYTRTVIEYLHPIMPPPASEVPAGSAIDPSDLLPHRESPYLASPEGAIPPTPSLTEAIAAPEQTAAGIAIKRSGTVAGLDLGQPEVAVSSEMAHRMADESRVGTSAVTTTVISDIAARILDLLKEYRWAEASPLATDLEKRLRLLPRKGRQVRDGWIALARVETQRLNTDKWAERPIDVSRLRMLREEAENVVD